MKNSYKIAILLTLAVALTSCDLFQKQTPQVTNNAAEQQPILEKKVGTLRAHPEDSEAAYLLTNDGTELFVQAENAEVNFLPFIGKEVELEGSMSYPPNPEARDQGVFHVKSITAK